MVGRILFDRVWKRFHRGPAHDSLRDLIPALGRRLTGRSVVEEDLGVDDFWAVRDVSFEVKPGEALGIIGGNGAGKSTTLKLLTKILRPTRGLAIVEGRVGSLIEVSAGFHQDLTGRENVFLQGAIMGMPQQLIRQRFDEIVEFSGISPFIDTPVKRYSSGMNARLGFSIAVHLEPDVLIVDEVLSVGDVEFQGKAFEKIRGLVKGDIPVVIVSHQLERVIDLCSECILLAKGEVTAVGRPAEVVQKYLGSWDDAAAATTPVIGGLQLTGLELSSGAPVRSGGSVGVVLRGTLRGQLPGWVEIVVTVRNAASNALIYSMSLRRTTALHIAPGTFAIHLSFDANLAAGTYRVESCIWDGLAEVTHHGPGALFEVVTEVPFAGPVQLSLRAP